MEPPTAKENILIEQLRTRLQDLELDEDSLLGQQLIRWIRAREHNINAAEAMIRTSISWRQQVDMKGLMSWDHDEFFPRHFPFTVCGFDYAGCPIVLIQAGRMDFRTAIDEGYLEDGVRYIYKRLEQSVNLLKKLSVDQPFMKQITAIIDCEGLQLRQITSRKLLTELAKCLCVYEANYPETLRYAVLLNVPSIFTIVYRIICKILSAKTLSKVQLHNYCVSKYSQELLKIMAPEEFPEKYGGSGMLTTNLFTEENLNNL